jgi:integrase
VARPRKLPLPRGIHVRKLARGGEAFWISFQYDKQQILERAGSTLTAAVELLALRTKQVREGSYVPGIKGNASASITLLEYAKRWLTRRMQDGVRTWKDDESRLRLHVVPYLGRVPIAELKRVHIMQWLDALRKTSLAPKSQENVLGVLHSLLDFAVAEDLLASNPASKKYLPKQMLPKSESARHVAPFSREETIALMSDPRLDAESRIIYQLAAFTGMRLGEVAGLRWRDIATDAKTLWRIELKSQYDGASLKTNNTRSIPVHPELAKALARWKLEGFPLSVGRASRPDDFVVTSASYRARVAHHTKSTIGKRMTADMALLGIEQREGEHRSFHSLRRTFITLARQDGARRDILERITHNAKGDMIDRYTFFGWDALCEQVTCLKLKIEETATVIALPPAKVTNP